MSQQINIQGSLGVVNNNQRFTSTLNGSLTTSGSNSVSIAANITTASFQALQSGSNVDFRIGCFTNNDLTSSIIIAIGGTGSWASILQPDDSCLLTYSASAVIYAKATGSHSPALLNYTLVSAN